MKTLLLTLKLLQPLLLSATAAGEENSAVSLDYIPGSMVRGSLIERFMQGHQGSDLLQDPLARQLFFSDEVLYLNGYLADGKGKRSLPTPASWRIEKGSEEDDAAPIYDLALREADDLADPKALKKPFCWVEEADDDDDGEVSVAVGKARRQPQLHNASDERFVKRENDSTLFRYDALAAGQRVVAVIQCADSVPLAEVRSLLTPSELLVGRSRSAGYGRVVIEQITESSTWPEWLPMDKGQSQPLVVTLLSDAILREPESGAYTTDFARGLVIKHNIKKAFVTSQIAGGFNRAWGMPLAQAPMLQAGSVWVFDYTPELMEQLRGYVQTGIGERRNEGFGRIAINWQGVAELHQQKPRSAGPSLPRSVVLAGNDGEQAKAMVKRLYRQRLEERLLELATGGLEIQGQIENAQLSRLRTLVSQATQTQQPTLVVDFLRSLRDTARTQFQRARLGGKPFLRWLEEGWKDRGLNTGGLWQEYFYIELGKRPRLGNVSAEDEESVQLEFMARLVDVVCKRAIQKQQQLEREGRGG